MVTLGELVMILDLARQGLTVAAIARRTGHDRKTIRKYIARGLEPPAYKPRATGPSLIQPFEAYLRERTERFPELTGRRLWRELRELGFEGGYSTVTEFLRAVRPAPPTVFERRFETPPGKQGQADFAFFKTEFADEPGVERVVWLFSLVLGHSRMMWARFVARQDLATVLRCHVAAFEALGGAPEQVLYDRMKTAVLGEVDERGIVYNPKLLDLAAHYGVLPKACRPYRAKTKGKVERPFRYVREDFFLARTFRNLDDLNAQLGQWLDQVANRRVHATTGRVVAEHFAEERPFLKPLPAGPFNAVLEPGAPDLARGHGLGRRQSLLRARQHAAPHRRGPAHRDRGPHPGGRPAHRRPSRARGPRQAPHRRGPPHHAAAGQQHHAPRGRRRAAIPPARRARGTAVARHLRRRRPPAGRPGGRAVSAAPSTLDRIRRHLVGLKMPRALEVLEHTLRQLERGEVSALEAIDTLLGEELTLREGRRVKAALKMGRLLTIKTLAGFDFAFQPSLDRNRILALAQLDFVDRHEVVHFLGQPGRAS